MELITLTIPAVPPTLNNMLRLHWSKRHRLMGDWKVLLLEALGRRRFPPARGPRRVVIRVTRGCRQDPDNRAFNAKLILDNLKKLRLIEDDRPSLLELQVEEQYGRRRQTIIEILEIEQGRKA